MRLSEDEIQDMQENAGRVTYRGVLDLLAALREAYGEIERLTGLIELCADREDMSSWTFEQRYGKAWHDATGDVFSHMLRAALAPAASEEGVTG